MFKTKVYLWKNYFFSSNFQVEIYRTCDRVCDSVYLYLFTHPCERKGFMIARRWNAARGRAAPASPRRFASPPGLLTEYRGLKYYFSLAITISLLGITKRPALSVLPLQRLKTSDKLKPYRRVENLIPPSPFCHRISLVASNRHQFCGFSTDMKEALCFLFGAYC